VELLDHIADGLGGLAISAGRGRLAQPLAVDPLHQHGVAIGSDHLRRPCPAIPFEELGAAPLVGFVLAVDLERRELAVLLLDAIDDAAGALCHAGRAGQMPLDHGAAERRIGHRLIRHVLLEHTLLQMTRALGRADAPMPEPAKHSLTSCHI
jgi:hypothetical protein